MSGSRSSRQEHDSASRRSPQHPARLQSCNTPARPGRVLSWGSSVTCTCLEGNKMRHYRAGQWVVIVVILAFAGAGLLRSAELAGRAQPPDAQRYAIIISIDGLMPASYTEADAHGLKIPAMRELMAAGAWSPGVRDVLPAVTYPAHTTMATGVSPARHGIVSNTVFDPLGQRDGEWYWYEPELRAPTLWQLARARGLRTSLIAWPVTMGAAGDAGMPEFWRGRGIDGAQLMRAISTPG